MVNNKPNRISNTSFEENKKPYPYNQAWVTEAGHEFHVDNTPGHERIRFSHAKGTFWEINSDGGEQKLTVGHSKTYHKGAMTLTVDENGDIKVCGHNRLNVEGGSHISVKGDADIVVGKNSHTVVGGNMKAAVAGNAYLGVKGNMNMNVKGNYDMKVAGDTTMTTTGKHTVVAQKIALNP